MPQLALFAADIVAVTLLVFGLYFPRHRRRDLVAAYLGVNIGVMAVASSLGTSSAGTGLGLGLALFGVLSIIRLRSTELDQHEVAYYFSALALGILSALGGGPAWQVPTMMALILVVMFVGDHPRLFRSYQRQSMFLDSAITDHVALVAYLEQKLGARVHSASVQRLDLVNDTTLVDVRYSHPSVQRAVRNVTVSTGGVPR
ncbi:MULTISPECIES: DUF4956 domain-containing protein [unclassified Plantactinospora]|uniref:DUF4956 domain-containing protein n=1 Tax=unclassified Plantactinospora TaxID=2631981 RepID=UPI000D179EF5|nr:MULTISPECIES: DUF4956 domain-containing protein [unclassified Plantactinospora]AVT30752.1 DUF4956 domain-containing protein [Plantactinospora sp. BC1]AVT37438.1 DUF4956 domain-containing protein [Plantactinospora sp. BB1]